MGAEAGDETGGGAEKEAPAAVEETAVPNPAPVAPPPTAESDAPHAASAASVDVAMLRRSWTSLLDHLSQNQQPVLRALLESATPAAFDGEALELAFPPSFRNNLRQVAARADKLQSALGGEPAPGDIARIVGPDLRQNLRADRGTRAIGGDQQVAGRARAVGEDRRDAAPVLFGGDK